MEEANDSEYTSFEHTLLGCAQGGFECLLIKHPYINNALNRLLAKWHSSFCTAGFSRSSFALADDGLPSRYQGRSSAHRTGCHRPSDQFGSVPKGLVCAPDPHVRDLLLTRGCPPQRRCPRTQVIENKTVLNGQRSGRGICESRSDSTEHLPLHSETAAKNGGDFDFDLVAVVEEIVSLILWSAVSHTKTGTKKRNLNGQRSRAPVNLALVANSGEGNQMLNHRLKTSCYAAVFEERPTSSW